MSVSSPRFATAAPSRPSALPGHPAAGYPLHDEVRALGVRTGIGEARSAPATGRGRQNHAFEVAERPILAGKGGRRPPLLAGGRWYERTAGHPILIRKIADVSAQLLHAAADLEPRRRQIPE